MNRLTATKICDHALQAAKELMLGVEVARNELPPDEAKVAVRQLAAALAAINEDVLLALFKEHPDLIPEQMRDAMRGRLGLE